ncbi:MAG: DNA (cytosine-5-)-methyltransferase [Deltaproteobacteria bacterium HGW-Deltaproteobacteria-6]|nr:MAG: DNA (cytosine-5-)-methyltransferase [Deltaproteobacteria bacterium HGW-Deltaproteobacteria-6]
MFIDINEAFNTIAHLDNIKLNQKTKENVFKKAVITHWLHGEIPNAWANKETQRHWCDCLGFDKKPIVIYSAVPFPPIPVNVTPQFRFIDLFAGIGGFRIALQELGGKCVFSSEWNAAAQQTYFRNFGEFPFGDIREFTSTEVSDQRLKKLIPDHEILAAGFPCQPFSHAGVSARSSIGKSHGFECKTQGTLFFDICRIVKEKEPKVLFLENVKNLQSHDSGRTFDTIKESIDKLGYDFSSDVIDASCEVPQHRERCYMVCFRKELKIKFEFPKFPDKKKKLKEILEDNVSEKYTISDRLWKGHIDRSARNVARGTGFTAYAVDLNRPSNTLVARYGKDGKECLIPQDGKNPRMLTPRECARLQGFHEKFIFPDARTPAYHQFGNAVVVPVIRKIAYTIVQQLNNKKGE